jgi:hypothetical protein
MSATAPNGTLADNVQQQTQRAEGHEEETQPDRSGGIPGLSFF